MPGNESNQDAIRIYICDTCMREYRESQEKGGEDRRKRMEEIADESQLIASPAQHENHPDSLLIHINFLNLADLLSLRSRFLDLR